MKKSLLKINILLLIATVLISSSFVAGDAKSKFPKVTIVDVNGVEINTKDFIKDGNPAYVAFWATWCVNCFKELKAVNENYEKWQKKTGVKVYAISIDSPAGQKRVKSVARKKGWAFDVAIDKNKELQKKLGVVAPPHTFIIDKKGNIVYQHVGYKPGDEKHAYEILKSLK